MKAKLIGVRRVKNVIFLKVDFLSDTNVLLLSETYPLTYSQYSTMTNQQVSNYIIAQGVEQAAAIQRTTQFEALIGQEVIIP